MCVSIVFKPTKKCSDTSDKITSSLRQIRESIISQELGLLSSPIWSQISERPFVVSFASLKYMLAWILLLSVK